MVVDGVGSAHSSDCCLCNGDRDEETCRPLRKAIPPDCHRCRSYSDFWKAYKIVLPDCLNAPIAVSVKKLDKVLLKNVGTTHFVNDWVAIRARLYLSPKRINIMDWLLAGILQSTISLQKIGIFSMLKPPSNNYKIMNQSWIKLIIVTNLLVFLGFAAQKLQAQTSDSPLILWIAKVHLNDYYAAGDLLALNLSNNEMRELASWVAGGTARLSPDGKQIAFTVYDKLAIDEITREQPQNYDWPIVPTNIALLDLGSNQISVLASQPLGSSFKIQYRKVKSSSYITRSAPVWSPDGTAIAWTETLMDHPSGLPTNPSSEPKQLIIYDLKQKKAKTILTNFTPQMDSETIDIQWGKPGIAVRSQDYHPGATGSAAFAGRILLYAATGKSLSTADVYDLDDSGDYFWVVGGQCEYIAVLTDRPFGIGLESSTWVVIQPNSGKVSLMNGVPELYSTINPNGLSLFPSFSKSGLTWKAATPGQEPVELGELKTGSLSSLPLAMTISSDGQKIAYIDKQGQAFTYGKEGFTMLKVSIPIDRLLWGPVAWRIRQSSSMGQLTDCAQ